MKNPIVYLLQVYAVSGDTRTRSYEKFFGVFADLESRDQAKKTYNGLYFQFIESEAPFFPNFENFQARKGKKDTLLSEKAKADKRKFALAKLSAEEKALLGLKE
ncbi:MAG: hypothetical protein WAX89_05025 [Alphaproteobacteria bacterium]